MKNKYIIQYEMFKFDQVNAYTIGLSKHDIKDIVIELLKIDYNKSKKLVFCNGKNTVAEIIKKDNFIISADGFELPLTDNDYGYLMSFLLDATEEYMSYDHIDLELSSGDQTVDVCFKINQ